MRQVKTIQNKFLILAVGFILLGFFTTSVKAQFQETTFSGGSKSSYQCFDPVTGEGSQDLVSSVKLNGYWLCNCEGGGAPSSTGVCGSGSCSGVPGSPGCTAQQAALIPPKLQQLEIWFVRILYSIWALIGSMSFIFLMVLGYRYVISRGDVTKITEVRQKIVYYFVGLALVFLAVPILTTVFRVLGINRDVECYNVEMPAFQFFFAELCTDPNGSINSDVLSDPCTNGSGAVGKTCNPDGTSNDDVRCNLGGGSCIIYTCSNQAGGGADGTGVWTSSTGVVPNCNIQ